MARYWIGDGGNWSDTAHWAASSGGSGGETVPTSSDDVYFDANSFSSASQTVTLNILGAACKDFNFTGVTNTPTFDINSRTLQIYGLTVTLVSGMSIVSPGGGTFRLRGTGTCLLTTAGKSLPGHILSDSTVTLSLQDDLVTTLNDREITINGSLTTNSYDITAGAIYFDSDGTFLLGTSTLGADDGIDFDLSGTHTPTISAASATLDMLGSATYAYLDGATVGTVNLYTAIGNWYMTGETITTLNMQAGGIYIFDNFYGDTIYVTNFNAIGTTSNRIYISSATAGVQHTFSKPSGVVYGDFLVLTDSNATGGATWNAGPNSTNLSNNSGWLFTTYVLPENTNWSNESIGLASWANAGVPSNSAWANTTIGNAIWEPDTEFFDATTYDDSSVTYDSSSVFYNGYDPSTATQEDVEFQSWANSGTPSNSSWSDVG